MSAHAPTELIFQLPINDASGSNPSETIVHYDLQPDHLKTRVVVTQSGFDLFAEGVLLRDVAEKHWQKALHQLKNKLEKELLPFP